LRKGADKRSGMKKAMRRGRKSRDETMVTFESSR
jgi:hypothetical protein